MKKVAFIFPGQGSQEVGMGRDIFHKNSYANTVFSEADQTLGFSLSALCFEGPESDLKETHNTQPALLTTSIALLQAGKDLLPVPDFVAGHSLGEYAALVASGVLSFENAVLIVRKRGEFMSAAVPNGLGAMAAVLGADRSLIGEVCQAIEESGDTVQMANINCPGQIVISGTTTGVHKAMLHLKEKGVKRIVELPVSGPFHSSLMKPASEALSDVLQSIPFHPPSIPVVENVTGKTEEEATRLKHLLVEQVHSPVLWEDSIRYMIEQGTDTFVEIGSGKVLSGLVKKIDRTVTVFNIFNEETLLQVSSSLHQLKEHSND